MRRLLLIRLALGSGRGRGADRRAAPGARRAL